jgi:AraC-like DNA-binding protein
LATHRPFRRFNGFVAGKTQNDWQDLSDKRLIQIMRCPRKGWLNVARNILHIASSKAVCRFAHQQRSCLDVARVYHRTFSDPHEYEAAFHGADVSALLPCDKGVFDAELTAVDLDAVWLQSGRETLARTAHLSIHGGRRSLAFLASPQDLPFNLSGNEFDGENVVLFGHESSHFQRTFGPLRWATISLPVEQFDEATRAIADIDLGNPADTVLLKPTARRLAELRLLHDAVVRMARAATEPSLDHPEVLRSLEHAFTVALVASLPQSKRVKSNGGSHRHQQIMGQFREWLEAHTDRAVYLQEICTALNVPARTLARCCEEHLGMSPLHYLWLRRMYLARRELLKAEAPASVTAAAMKFGFWHLGRFAVEYRSLFAEPPSATLARNAAA